MQTTSTLHLTETAIEKAASLLAQTSAGESGLRVGVKKGGCSGMSYELRFDKEQPGDKIIEASPELKVFVDETSAEVLGGTVLDYVDSLQGAGFQFSNPNAAKTCGCGKSFC